MTKVVASMQRVKEYCMCDKHHMEIGYDAKSINPRPLMSLSTLVEGLIMVGVETKGYN